MEGKGDVPLVHLASHSLAYLHYSPPIRDARLQRGAILDSGVHSKSLHAAMLFR
jgi:hypothetical protein